VYFFLYNLALANIGLAAPQSQIWSWTFRLRAESSLIWAALLRCLFSSSLDVWMTCFWVWWIMTSLQPSVNPCITQSLWTLASLSCYFQCCFISLLDLPTHNLIVLPSSCFKDVEIPNFFCYSSQVLHLSCSDTLFKNVITFFIGFIFGIFPISGIFFSFYKCFSSILKIASSSGRYKAFSICGSHLSVICLF
jgi:olfactory receptor